MTSISLSLMRLSRCLGLVGRLRGSYGMSYPTYGLTITKMCKAQFDWVERMGWHNGTVLEKLALIASEVGEAVNECRGEKPTKEFGIELADIVLRVADLAEEQGIDLEACILKKMEINEDRGTRGRRI